MKKNLKNILSVILLVLGLAMGSIFVFAVVSKTTVLFPAQEEIEGMVAVIGLDGKHGYVTAKDFNSPYTPEGVIIPVYDKDCKTIIDSLQIGGSGIVSIHGNEQGARVEFDGKSMSLEEFAALVEKGEAESPIGGIDALYDTVNNFNKRADK